MEDNTQIKINVGPMEESSVVVTPVVDETETEVTTPIIQEIPTIPIEIDKKREPLPVDDDVLLVSPDIAIFNRVTEKLLRGCRMMDTRQRGTELKRSPRMSLR